MNRRTAIRSLMTSAAFVAGAGTSLGATQAKQAPAPAKGAAPAAARPIQLHCDLAVDPKREKEVEDFFVRTFRPTAMKHEGYIDLKLVRLKQAVRGNVPNGCLFRFVLTYKSEELRQKWIASADHQRVWPPIENALTDKNFSILVYEVI
jgi:hypothetical protein